MHGDSHGVGAPWSEKFGKLISLWVFVSAFYYSNSLITGRLLTDEGEGAFHKAAKYLVCFLFGMYLVGRSGQLQLAGIGLIVGLQAVALFVATEPAGTTLDVHLIIVAIVGLIPLLSTIGSAGRARLNQAMTVAGAMVGGIAIVEVNLLAELFADYWAQTGGIRAISTLFNPNNLGVFLGACLIIALSDNCRGRIRTLALPLIAAGLYLSNSRTAWIGVALIVVASTFPPLLPVSGRPGRPLVTLGALFALLTMLGLILILFSGLEALDSSGQAVEARALDTYTASIRFENMNTYLDQIGIHSLLPDIRGQNFALTTDNSYLVIVNSLGLIPTALLVLLIAVGYRLSLEAKEPGMTAWQRVLCFYLFVALGDSTVNAFPNNQFFAIALGSVLASRLTWRRSR